MWIERSERAVHGRGANSLLSASCISDRYNNQLSSHRYEAGEGAGRPVKYMASKASFEEMMGNVDGAVQTRGASMSAKKMS